MPGQNIDVADLYTRLGRIEERVEDIPGIKKDVSDLKGFKIRVYTVASGLSAIVGTVFTLITPYARTVVGV